MRLSIQRRKNSKDEERKSNGYNDGRNKKSKNNSDKSWINASDFLMQIKNIKNR